MIRCRDFGRRDYGHFHPFISIGLANQVHRGGAVPLALSGPANVVTLDGVAPYSGMDPSDPRTWVRRYNPQPGMVARLNFDGAAVQGNTPMGGTWANDR